MQHHHLATSTSVVVDSSRLTTDRTSHRRSVGNGTRHRLDIVDAHLSIGKIGCYSGNPEGQRGIVTLPWADF